ncbi:RNA polymerase sigma factor [Sphingobacterium sp. HJSM2_6]|uniref:RNA polymerase sigma factor n=1 Tax=Sphingobacterium sp. HJSM2_6 TaxID=3366264 RepID=UPI003BCF9F24
MESTDSSVVDELRKGSQKAFNLIVKKYNKQLWLYFKQKTNSHEIAEELTNDIFNRLWDYRSKLDTEKSLDALIREMTRGRFCKWLEKYEREKRLKNDYLIATLTNDEHTGGEDALNASMDLTIMVDKLTLMLPKKRCQVFLMSRMQGMSYEEIAAQLSISKATVKDHLIKAKKTISVLKDNWHYP